MLLHCAGPARLQDYSNEEQSKMNQKKVVRTSMSAALIGAVHYAVKHGTNPGRLGRIILTNEAKGVGVRLMPRERKTA